MPKTKLISIISPAFNEAKNVTKIAKEVGSVMSQLKGFDYEYIFVDDGSSDTTWEEITKMAKSNRRIRGIRFTRNFGQQIAISAGIDKAKGDAIIYCDSDLQHPPKLFPKLISEWVKGAKVVHTKRLKTEDISTFKKIMSKLFYAFTNTVSDTQIEEGMADFKLLDREAYSELKLMREKNKFLRGMVSWMGYPSAVVNYQARKREAGRPWYNFQRNLEFAKTGVLSLSTKPLKYILYFGLFLIIISAMGLITVSAITLYKRDLRFFSPTIILVIFNTLLIGFVIACLGIVAIYISYLHKEIVKRPTYLISDTINIR